MTFFNSEDFHINSSDDLLEIISAIQEKKIVALDTEFTRRTTYYPIPSIIQGAIKIDGKKKKFILDCQLAKFDLSSFFDVICDKKITKILHSCSQDLQIFHRAHNIKPQSIADTQIMANFCDFGFNVGYSGLVENLFSQKINKDQQRSDWQRRPLSQKQLEYALLDVEFLHEIYEKFAEILAQKKRQSWFEEELEVFVTKAVANPKESLMKKFSFKRRSDQQIAQIQNLAIWREKESQENDVLRQYFLKDEDIENIVVAGFIAPKKYPRINEKRLFEIEEILKNSQKAPFKMESSLFLNEEGKKSFDLARNLIVKTANNEKLPAQFLLTSSELKKAINYQGSFDNIICGWRHDLFGKELKKIIL
jgi:ribonuclease D